jgi:hypothetical protein
VRDLERGALMEEGLTQSGTKVFSAEIGGAFGSGHCAWEGSCKRGEKIEG